MHIVWCSWKDRKHPLAGGAETVSGEIMDRLVRDGHKVSHITASFKGGLSYESINGINVNRSGSRYSVYLEARKRLKNDFKDADLIIDEMNTIPFGIAFYSSTPSVLLSYQLARKVWLYQMKAPLSYVGYMLEPLYLKALSKRYTSILTESASTKVDMVKYGFDESNIKIFRIGMGLKPITELPKAKDMDTVLILGALRPMKRTLHAVKAFEVARIQNSELKLVIAGDDNDPYAANVRQYIANSDHRENISLLGRVDSDTKKELMQKASVILVTSVKEGWGLIVTEANSQGTPAIVYDTDGLRDSVQKDVTGLIVPDGSFDTMGKAIVELLDSNGSRYETLRCNAWKWSKEFTFENSYRDFIKATSIQPAD